MLMYQKSLINQSLIPAGNYTPVITSVKALAPVKLENHPNLVPRVLVTFDIDGKTLSNSFLMTGTDKRLNQLIDSTLGDIDDVDLEDLVGKSCNIDVIHKEAKDGRIFPQVININPIEDEDESYEDDSEDLDEGPEFSLDDLDDDDTPIRDSSNYSMPARRTGRPRKF